MNKDLIKKVEQWFIDRNLHTGDPLKQWEKLVEEFGELVKAKNKNDIDTIKDSIGDMLVVMIGIAMQTEQKLIDKEIEIIEIENCTEMKEFMFDLLAIQSTLSDLFKHRRKSTRYMYTTGRLSVLILRLDLLAKEYNTTLDECLTLAYDEIKDRKGKLIGGVFVKEGDL